MTTKPTDNSAIELRTNRGGDLRAYVRGTRMRVQDIVIRHQRLGDTAEQIALDQESVSLAQVHAALAYYFENPEAIQKMIREDEEFTARMMSTDLPIAGSPPSHPV
ncbi:MAG: DUF433 domain-containing protein [Planctomycetaceae bacterium]|nr:DUF433 domain-containing protein [Planctomycetaceae bacterium]